MVFVVSSFDPSASTGILQDIKSLALLGITAIGVISAYTIQNDERDFYITLRGWKDIDRELNVLGKPSYIKLGSIMPELTRFIRVKYPSAKIIWDITSSLRLGDYFEPKIEVSKNLDYADYFIINKEWAEGLSVEYSEKCILIFEDREERRAAIKYRNGEYYVENIPGRKIERIIGISCILSSLFTGYLSLGYLPEEAIYEAMAVLKKIIELSDITQIQSEKLARDWMKYEALERLEKIIPELEAIGSKTVPEVGQNISYALPWASSEEEVAKFPGRIRLKEGKPVLVSGPSFRDKSHTARMALAAKIFAPHIRCVSNIKYDKNYIENAKRAGLKVFRYERGEEPLEVANINGKSMNWMIRKAFDEMGEVPDIIYDEGWFGKEAMIRVFGKEPKDVLRKIRLIIGVHEKI